MKFLPAIVVDPRCVCIGDIELDCAGDLEGLGQGSAVTLCVRPEDVTVQGDGREARNAAQARVDDLEFLGAFYRATLSVEGMGDQRLTVDFTPSLVSGLNIRAGTDLTVVFPDDRIRVFVDR